MRLECIPEGELLNVKFEYLGKDYDMQLSLFAKYHEYIVVPAILDKGIPRDPDDLKDKRIIYKTQNGIFEYSDIKVELRTLSENYVYKIASGQDVVKLNRREAYRVFIGESIVIKCTSANNKERTFMAILKDISILGMGIVSANEIGVGDYIETVYQVNNGLRILLNGTVIRVSDMSGRRSRVYGIKFDGRTEVLSKIIMQRQIEKIISNTDNDIGWIS